MIDHRQKAREYAIRLSVKWNRADYDQWSMHMHSIVNAKTDRPGMDDLARRIYQQEMRENANYTR
jgi:hypothetical protein